MKVYTKTGDEGQTSLLSRQRVFKDHVRVDAYGTVDEANAAMGLAKALANTVWVSEIVEHIQQELVALNADLATQAPMSGNQYRITPAHIEWLETTIDTLEQRRIPQRYFVIPGGTPASAALDLARTVVRRAERCTVRLKRETEVPGPVLLYLNRLSDLLFVLARCVEQEELVATVTGEVLRIINGDKPEVKIKDGVTMLDKAKKMLAAAEQKALEIGVPMVIAVVDAGGNLVAQHRMDGALLASISIALDKAYTAVALKMPTETAAALTAPGRELFGLNTANGGRFIIFGGGLPIVSDGCIIGGLGVSGGSVAEDITVAKAGLAAWD